MREQKLTQSQKDFIGTQFKTYAGNILTVTRVHSVANNGSSVFALNCNVCSKDEDLFKSGDLVCAKSTLVAGSCPCACSKHYNWSERQQLVRVNRRAEELGYVFEGWVGEFKGANTKVKLRNPSTGFSWSSTSLYFLLSKGVMDPSLSGVRLSTSDQKKRYLEKGGYPSYVDIEKAFTRGKTTHWWFICGKCSTDIFTNNGLCSGRFLINTSNMLKGKIPCRCYQSHVLTQEQLEYLLLERFVEIGGEFLGWGDGYKNKGSKAVWMCCNGHLVTQSADKILADGGCKYCTREKNKFKTSLYGYYENRVEEEDNLYLMLFKGKNDILKVGRTFEDDCSTRLRHLKAASGILDVQILATYTGKHHYVFHTEQAIHEYLRGLDGRVKTKWSREPFKPEHLDVVKDLLKVSPLRKSDLIITDL